MNKIKYTDDILGLIPARGGSKSIPLKNLATIDGKPMLYYSFQAVKQCALVTKVLCSTDNEHISSYCDDQSILVHVRPDELAQDNTPVVDVISHVLHDLLVKDGCLPWAVALIQPTSPFLLPEHITDCIGALKADNMAQSVQSVTNPPHNHHAFNQRYIEDGYVSFYFEEERKLAYNKQTKPRFYIFGNLVVTRTQALLDGGGVFAKPSLAVEIPIYYALDVDGPADLYVAEWYIKTEKVFLNHTH